MPFVHALILDGIRVLNRKEGKRGEQNEMQLSLFHHSRWERGNERGSPLSLSLAMPQRGKEERKGGEKEVSAPPRPVFSPDGKKQRGVGKKKDEKGNPQCPLSRTHRWRERKGNKLLRRVLRLSRKNRGSEFYPSNVQKGAASYGVLLERKEKDKRGGNEGPVNDHIAIQKVKLTANSGISSHEKEGKKRRG